MILRTLFQSKPVPGEILFNSIVASSRQPKFYLSFNVPDTLDGRFDMLVLHMYLVLDRLKPENLPDLRQSLTDLFFRDMDRSLRELGVGDISVGKKVRKMAEAFYGRVGAYDAAMAQDQPALAAAIRRNIYADVTEDKADGLASWAIASRDALSKQPIGNIIAGELELPNDR